MSPFTTGKGVAEDLFFSLPGPHGGWFEMREDLNILISKCDVFCRTKQSSRKPRAAVGGIRVGAPLDRVSFDLIGPLPETRKGN
jgi:hypothetical protein